LTDLGAPLFTAATDASAIAAAIEDFFALEASGWKGRAGTAAASRENLRGFVTTALCGLAAEGKAAINRLLLDGRAIAAAITLRSGDTAWYWKIAYDEMFARYAPGILLTAALTEELADNMAIARTDSCAEPNSILDYIWGERLALCDRLIAVRPEAPFARACRLEMLRGGAAAAVKSIRNRFGAQR
jgi:hypothetical protein